MLRHGFLQSGVRNRWPFKFKTDLTSTSTTHQIWTFRSWAANHFASKLCMAEWSWPLTWKLQHTTQTSQQQQMYQFEIYLTFPCVSYKKFCFACRVRLLKEKVRACIWNPPLTSPPLSFSPAPFPSLLSIPSPSLPLLPSLLPFPPRPLLIEVGHLIAARRSRGSGSARPPNGFWWISG